MATEPAQTARAFGAQSMTAPLREALVKRPGPAFARGFDEPGVGFLHPVDLPLAQRQHEALCELLRGLGVALHALDEDGPSPDAVYTFDPLLVSDRGQIVLRSGKPKRRSEEAHLEAAATAVRIPVAGRSK